MTRKPLLAIVTSHPIQYNAPLFQLLTERNRVTCRVFYTWGKSAMADKFDPGFGKVIEWDLPLLDGYDYEVLENTAKERGSHHFKGIVNPDLIHRIDQFGPDAILVFGWAFQSHLKVLRHYRKKKVILFRGDSTQLDQASSIKKRIRSLFLKWIYRHIDVALYVGKNNRDYYLNAGLKEDQLVYAPHAIDNRRFSEDEEERERQALLIREKIGIEKEAFVFLYAGKLEPVKNLPLLLKAFVLSGLGDKAKLVIVGNGVLESRLKSEYESRPGIVFMDFQNQAQMPVIYRISNLFILCSRSETWGLSVNEAMACSRAVLVSDHCGCAPDLVVNDKNGFLFKSEDVDDLKDKLLLAFNNRSRLEEMGKVSLEHIKGFSFGAVAQKIEETVEKRVL